MLPALLVAACAAWHADAVGYYPGTVLSSGEQRPIDTWIEEGADGRLRGRYVLHEPTRDVPGTLDAVGDSSCDTATFKWTDLYGSGFATLHFFPAAQCFEGAWGAGPTIPTLAWHACTRDKVTS